jgi:DNA-binding transcriptional regulator YiaG
MGRKSDIRSLPFARWIRGRRAYLGDTQAAAALTMGVTPKTLRAWEQGTAVPTQIAHLLRVAAWAGMGSSDVLEILLESHT